MSEDATTLEQWRSDAAKRLDWEAEELEAGGGPGIFTDNDRDIAAQTYRNAATKIRNLPLLPASA